MSKNNKKKELNIVSRATTVVADGNLIGKNQFGDLELGFFQILPHVKSVDNSKLDVSVVATVRMELKGLKTLRDLVDDAIKRYESESKAK